VPLIGEIGSKGKVKSRFRSIDLEEEMDLTPDEKAMLRKIADNPYSGGAYKRATWIDMICPTKADKALLETLCDKGLTEIGLGGTVAGDPYDACWLTPRGKEELDE
jgi:hypothetical protein